MKIQFEVEEFKDSEALLKKRAKQWVALGLPRESVESALTGIADELPEIIAAEKLHRIAFNPRLKDKESHDDSVKQYFKELKRDGRLMRLRSRLSFIIRHPQAFLSITTGPELRDIAAKLHKLAETYPKQRPLKLSGGIRCGTKPLELNAGMKVGV